MRHPLPLPLEEGRISGFFFRRLLASIMPPSEQHPTRNVYLFENQGVTRQQSDTAFIKVFSSHHDIGA